MFECGNVFHKSLDIDVVKVNSENSTIEDDDLLNTKTQVWLEAGEPYSGDESGIPGVDPEEVFFNSHNIDYDCGGDTFEDAIIKMANLVYEKNYPGKKTK